MYKIAKHPNGCFAILQANKKSTHLGAFVGAPAGILRRGNLYSLAEFFISRCETAAQFCESHSCIARNEIESLARANKKAPIWVLLLVLLRELESRTP